MSKIKFYLKKHTVLFYFLLTFTISWGGVLIAVGGPGGIPGTKEEFDSLFPFVLITMLAGPSISGILLTSLVYGRSGLREFRSRLLKWRVSIQWYAIALLTAPILTITIFLVLTLTSTVFLPSIFVVSDKVTHVLFGIVVGFLAGLIEELGWTGFVVPELRKRYSILITGLIVGFFWAAWHLLVAFWASGTVTGNLSLTSYIVDPLLGLTLFRVLMVWVYDRTGSLLIGGILMHMSLTSSGRVICPQGILGLPLMTYDLIWFIVMWVVVAIIARGSRGQLWRQPREALPG